MAKVQATQVKQDKMGEQIAVMGNDITHIKDKLDKLVDKMDSLVIKFESTYITRHEHDGWRVEVERRVTSLENWQTWTLRTVVGLVISAIVGAVYLIK